MGNKVSRAAGSCLIPSCRAELGNPSVVLLGNYDPPPPPPPADEGLGHSFCYVRPPTTFSSDSISWEFSFESERGGERSRSMSETSFKAISGASVSANTATPSSIMSTSLQEQQFNNSSNNILFDRASSFESTSSFSALPLQPRGFLSGPLERGFMSGPMERGALSGPLEAAAAELHPVHKQRRRSKVGVLGRFVRTLSGPLQKALSRSMAIMLEKTHHSLFVPMKLFANLQWAQGKAGEDRVHVVLSEEHGWLFVGIYDGFNGPDAPDFLMNNLYPAIYRELKGLLWDQDDDEFDFFPGISTEKKGTVFPGAGSDVEGDEIQRLGNNFLPHLHTTSLDHHHQEKLWLEQEAQNNERSLVDHGAVLEALERALKATEAAYLEMADRVLYDNPELMVMGSCVLVMLMKDEDVYIMNVGDSRAVVAQEVPKKGRLGSLNISVVHAQPNSIPAEEAEKTGVQDTSLFRLDLDKIIEETPRELECLQVKNVVRSLAPLEPASSLLKALQLSSDHSTSILEEVLRIKAEHPNDENVIFNDRVKGRLKVTRAFGAGFLKQPTWNNALLKMFRCNFEGTDPYITCKPFLHHHRLSPQDQFLVLSSDGLYQYLSNEEVVCHVEWFMQNFPDGDPAQHLIEELLFRAAKKNGMDFHELLDIPQGDRRKYHDDVYVMVISLEGRIWKSSG
ncbi:unnamed protein product [Sphagnum balticum]